MMENLIVVTAVSLLALFSSVAVSAGADGAQVSPLAAQLIALASSEDQDKQTFCLNGAPYGGCCSYHGGIQRISATGQTVFCNDGKTSPSCTQHLRGCCSDNDGVDEVIEDGTVICKNGKQSPSCSCGKDPI